jgi:hypothetical protein
MDLESEASLPGIGGKAVGFLHQQHSFTSLHKDNHLYAPSLLRASQSLESLFVIRVLLLSGSRKSRQRWYW